MKHTQTLCLAEGSIRKVPSEYAAWIHSFMNIYKIDYSWERKWRTIKIKLERLTARDGIAPSSHHARGLRFNGRCRNTDRFRRLVVLNSWTELYQRDVVAHCSVVVFLMHHEAFHAMASLRFLILVTIVHSYHHWQLRLGKRFTVLVEPTNYARWIHGEKAAETISATVSATVVALPVFE